MDSFLRLLPYVKPRWRRITLSFFFAALLALMWGLNLSAAFPVVKVLLQGQSLHEYVAAEAAEAERTIANRTAMIEAVDAQLVDVDRDTKAEWTLTAERDRISEKVSLATNTLATMRWLEFRVLPWVPEDRYQTFALLVGLLLFATLLKGVFLFVQEVLVGQVVQYTLQDIRRDCFSQALRLDYPTVAADGASTLMARFTYDAEQLATGLTILSGRLVREPLKAVTCVALALYVNWRLTLLAMLFVPLLGFAIHQFGRMVKRASRRMLESMTVIYGQLEETFDGLKVVTAYGTQARHREEFSATYTGFLDKAIKVVKLEAITKPTGELIATTAVCAAMLPCAYLVLTGKSGIWGIRLSPDRMDIAEVATLYAALAGLLDPCQKLSKVYSKVKRCGAAIDRVFAFLDREPAVTDPEQPLDMPAVSDGIEFRGVTFTYPRAAEAAEAEGRGPVLNALTLRIAAGECVAVVGENGCGKSTLINLLPRFYEPDAGEIAVDNVSITQVRQADLRQSMALVSQETVLFDTTIRENIAYGSPERTALEVEEAAQRAAVTAFASQMPLGLDTPVGTKGRALSGGQRQRVALARAMLRDPRILILDEATSAIDAQSESEIHAALADFVKGRTTILITHQMPEALRDCVDRVVALAEGQVEAVGTPDEMLDRSPTYQRLFGGTVRVAA